MHSKTPERARLSRNFESFFEVVVISADMDEQKTSDAAPPGRIGAVTRVRRGKLTVVSTTPDGPAARAGLRAGDHIVRIDASDTATLGRKEAAARIRGPAGTQVTLWIARTEGEALPVQVTREAGAASPELRVSGKLVLGLLGVLAFVAGIVAVTRQWSSDHVRAVQVYAARLREGDTRGAYEHLTTEGRSALSYEAWLASMNTPLLVRASELEIGATRVNSTGRGCVRSSVSATDGQRVALTFYTRLEEDSVRIHRVMTNEEQSGWTEQGPWSCNF